MPTAWLTIATIDQKIKTCGMKSTAKLNNELRKNKNKNMLLEGAGGCQAKRLSHEQHPGVNEQDWFRLASLTVCGS